MRDLDGHPPVREQEHVRIPLEDGVRLSSRIWLPASADVDGVPAVIEAIPYRKRHGTRLRDEPIHRYFAAHGYASLRIDLRGSGESEGTLDDEYTAQELEDLQEALRWVGRQPWCSGAVGLFGKSWGGINALQVAARRPPELGAVVTVCSTDDRYRLDAHYAGGCLLTENFKWGTAFMFTLAHPPDPALVGDRWRDMWSERLDALPLFPARWLEHPYRDEYWQRGSVIEDYSSIEAPVFAVGGWADPYCTAVLRLLEGLRCPRRGWIGPWAHLYPHDGQPGPPGGFLQECVAWWDRWLGGAAGPSAVAAPPGLAVWMQEGFPIADGDDRVSQPGRWVTEEAWPSPRVHRRSFALNGRQRTVPLDLSIGCHAGAWCPFGAETELPRDQSADDDRALLLDGPPLDEPLELLGTPWVRLVVEPAVRSGQIVARLCEVAPDGRSRLVSWGVQNLALADDLSGPRALEPGRPLDVEIALGATAYRFRAGHHLRLALSASLWPLVWPVGEAGPLEVRLGPSPLDLPVREAGAGPEIEWLPPAAHVGRPASSRDPEPDRTLRRPRSTGHTLEIEESNLLPGGEPPRWVLEELGLTAGSGIRHRYRIIDGEPLSASHEVRRVATLDREGWHVRLEMDARMISTAESFVLSAELRADLEGERFSVRRWDRSLPRGPH